MSPLVSILTLLGSDINLLSVIIISLYLPFYDCLVSLVNISSLLSTLLTLVLNSNTCLSYTVLRKG